MLFRKSNKIYRIELGGYKPKGKYHLASKTVAKLLKGTIDIFEKVDGANTGIYKIDGKISLQRKRGAIDYSHPQYSFFQNEWYWKNINKLEKLPDNIVVYGELMRCKHTIYYNKLPDWFLVFDIYDLKRKRYMHWEDVKKICENVGLNTVPHIATVKIKDVKRLYDYIPLESKYGDTAEGIVVKNSNKQLMGKWVHPWFVKTIEDSKHWQDQPIVLNAVV